MNGSARRESILACCVVIPLAGVFSYFAVRDHAVWPINDFEILSIFFFSVVLLKQYWVQERPGAGGDRNFRGLAIVIAAAVGAYIPTIPHFFLCDDFEHLALLRQPFSQSVWPQFTVGQSGAFYRPLGFASLFIDHRLWHLWSPGYHLTALMLHVACVVGLFFLCRELEMRDESATTAALIFALLPVNAQAVAWIGCRFDLLATGCMLWALAGAARFRRTGQLRAYIFSIVCFVVATLSKESAYTLPFLWVALEICPRTASQLQASSPVRRWAPLAGYLAVAAAAFSFRCYILGGIGGYSGQSVSAQKFGWQSVIGVLVRAPAEMLFGYNPVQPAPSYFVYAVAVTAAMLLTLALLARPGRSARRLTWFSLIWITTSVVPAHFNFVISDSLLVNSRNVHFGSAGLAILLALLLENTFSAALPRRVYTATLAALLLLGVQHNIAAWKWASQCTSNFLEALKQMEPEPPPGTAFRMDGVPLFVRGVPFFTVGLQNAVRFNYGWRSDITAERLTRTSPPCQPSDYCMLWWDGRNPKSVALGDIADPEPMRIR